MNDKRKLKKVFAYFSDMRLPAIYDSIFKLLFSEKGYLSKILTFFLPYDINTIKSELVIKNSEILNFNITSHGSIGDLIINVKEYTILIECNIKKSKKQESKNMHTLYGVGFTQYNRGEVIDTNKKLLLLSFDNYDFLGKNELRYDGIISDKVMHIPFYNNLEIIHINLALARNILYNTNEIAKLDDFTKCLIMIVNPSKKIGNILERDDYMGKANKRLNTYIEDYRYVSKVINDAYKRSERKIGEKIGKKIGQENVARRMINNNFDDETIAKCTELSFNRIKSLRQSNL